MPLVTSENKAEFDRAELEKRGLLKPQIEVKHDEKKNWLSAHHPNGQVGGKVKNNALHITYSELDEKERNKGHGKAMYQALIDKAHEKGYKVFSDSTVEMPAVHIYKSLARNGYNVERLPGGGELPPNEDIPHGAYYGHGASNPVFEVKPKKLTK